MDIRNSKKLLLHVQAAIHSCKQMELDVNFSNAQGAVTNTECDWEIAKEAYAQVHSSKKKKAKVNKGEVVRADSESLALDKTDYEKAMQTVAATKPTIMMEGAKAFKLYANLH